VPECGEAGNEVGSLLADGLLDDARFRPFAWSDVGERVVADLDVM
jgi:hypothetical protein